MDGPHAALRPFAEKILGDGRTQNGLWNRPLVLQVTPSGRAGPGLATRRPALGNRQVWHALPRLPLPGGGRRHEANQIGDDIERCGKWKAIEVLDKAEHVALGVGQGIEPPLAIMDDDNDVVAAAILYRAAGAFLGVDGKTRRFQHRAAGDFSPQLFQVCFFHSYSAFLAVLCPGFRSRSVRGGSRRPRRARQDKGAAGKPAIVPGRQTKCQKRRSLPCRPPRASGIRDFTVLSDPPARPRVRWDNRTPDVC